MWRQYKKSREIDARLASVVRDCQRPRMAGDAKAAGRCNAFAREEASGSGFPNGRFQQDDEIVVYAEIEAEERDGAAANEV